MKPILFFILITLSITSCEKGVSGKTASAVEGELIVIDSVEVLK